MSEIAKLFAKGAAGLLWSLKNVLSWQLILRKGKTSASRRTSVLSSTSKLHECRLGFLLGGSCDHLRPLLHVDLVANHRRFRGHAFPLPQDKTQTRLLGIARRDQPGGTLTSSRVNFSPQVVKECLRLWMENGGRDANRVQLG